MRTISSLFIGMVLVLVACAAPEAPADEPSPAAPGGSPAGSPAAAEVSGEVMLYTSVPEGVINEIKARFEEANPGVTVSIFRGTTGDVQARIAVEQEAGELAADLIMVAEPSAYEAYKDQDLLAEYAVPEDAGIRESFIDPDGMYVAARIINMVVAWNTDQLPEGLSDWPDLIDNAEGAVYPSPNAGSALAGIKAIRDEFGDDFFQRFADAGGSQVASNGAAADGLISGEFTAAGVLDYFIRDAKADGSPVELAYPESGTVVIPSPIAITSTAQNPDAARAFIDYVLSAEGQEAMVEVGSFYPVRSDVEPPEGAPALDEIPTLEVDWRELVEETEEINATWSEIFGG